MLRQILDTGFSYSDDFLLTAWNVEYYARPIKQHLLFWCGLNGSMFNTWLDSRIGDYHNRWEEKRVVGKIQTTEFMWNFAKALIALIFISISEKVVQ